MHRSNLRRRREGVNRQCRRVSWRLYVHYGVDARLLVACGRHAIVSACGQDSRRQLRKRLSGRSYPSRVRGSRASRDSRAGPLAVGMRPSQRPHPRRDAYRNERLRARGNRGSRRRHGVEVVLRGPMWRGDTGATEDPEASVMPNTRYQQEILGWDSRGNRPVSALRQYRLSRGRSRPESPRPTTRDVAAFVGARENRGG